jgi:hypothetical protein
MLSTFYEKECKVRHKLPIIFNLTLNHMVGYPRINRAYYFSKKKYFVEEIILFCNYVITRK